MTGGHAPRHREIEISGLLRELQESACQADTFQEHFALTRCSNHRAPSQRKLTPRSSPQKRGLITPQRAYKPSPKALVCGVLIIVCLTLLVREGIRFRDSVLGGACLERGQVLQIGMSMYAADYDGRLPPADRWADALWPYTKWDIRCSSRPKIIGAYAFNRALDHVLCEQLTQSTPVFFESNSGKRNHADRLESFTRPHAGKGVVALGDETTRLFAAPPNAVIDAKRDSTSPRR